MSKVVFYPVDNGDTSLIKVDSTTVVTDLYLRKDAEDDNKDETYDVAAALREECEDNTLSLFVNTHPDKDHVLGFSDLFHTGKPDNHKGKDDDRILVNEIWITPYSENLKDFTEQNKPFMDEANRRLKLKGKAEGNDDGNRIQVMQSDMEDNTGTFGDDLEYRVLSPTQQECDDAAGEKGNTNNSSLGIRWLLPQENDDRFAVMLMGDAEREVHARLNRDVKEADLRYHVLVAPHHMSRTAFATKRQDSSDKDPDDKRYELDEDAKNALSHALEPGYIVASSKPPKENGKPPHVWAHDRYVEILDEVEDDGEDRILNPASHLNGDKPAPVCFENTGDGYTLLDAADDSGDSDKDDDKKDKGGKNSAGASAAATAALVSRKATSQPQIYG